MSTTRPSPRAPTLADLDALPAGVVGEIIEGVLYTMTKPRARHQRTGLEIGSGLLGPFDHGRGGPGGWWIITEPGIELPNTPEISPDVAGWRRERLPELPVDEPIRVVPDWICEILSPTTRRHDQLVKLPYYAKVGVAYAWVVDLESRVMNVPRLEEGTWRTSARTATRARRGSRVRGGAAERRCLVAAGGVSSAARDDGGAPDGELAGSHCIAAR